MAVWTYDESLRRLLVYEGGYTNHPQDPGGPTNFGITIADYRKYIKASGMAEDVRRMSVDQAKAIYKSKYWDAMRCDDLPAGVDFAVFDYGVNSGTGRAPRVLKRIIGLDASNSVITPEAIEAARRRDPKALTKGICDERLRFLQSLRTWPTFGTGWGRRVREVLAAALAMITRGTTAPAIVPPAIPKSLGKGMVPEPKAAKEAIRTGVPTATAATGGTFWDWVVAHPKTSILIAAAVIAAVVFGLRALKNWHTSKQETPMPNTPIVPEINQ